MNTITVTNPGPRLFARLEAGLASAIPVLYRKHKWIVVEVKYFGHGHRTSIAFTLREVAKLLPAIKQ